MPNDESLAVRNILAADVGGTHARVGVVRMANGGMPTAELVAYATFECGRFPSLGAILQRFLLEHAGLAIDAIAVACAGYLDGDRMVNSNLAWPVERLSLIAALGGRDVELINDFEALACGIGVSTAREAPLIGGKEGERDAPVLVIGPGTGLGAAVQLGGRAGACSVLHTEAGQVSLAPSTPVELRILEHLLAGRAHVTAESVLSGPGLLTLYQALAALDGEAATLDSPAAVTSAALNAADPRAIRTLSIFCGLLGSYVGDLVLLYGARGGVYLAGGVLPRIRGYLQQSAFHERMVNKGVMRPVLERVPVRLLETGHLGVVGAASWYLQQIRKNDGVATSDRDLIAPLHATQR